jgi:hypothetical protein
MRCSVRATVAHGLITMETAYLIAIRIIAIHVLLPALHLTQIVGTGRLELAKLALNVCREGRGIQAMGT